MFSSKINFIHSYTQKINSLFAKPLEEASDYEKYFALGSLVRDYINTDWARTNKHYLMNRTKQVYYFSMEFLLGKMLEMNLINLGILEVCVEALRDLGINFDGLLQVEKDPGLGNGGLGRLAACFMDSLASLSMPGHGCGIRYKHGLFDQKIIDGCQVEFPDQWLKDGYVWEIRRPDKAVEVKFGGKVYEEIREGKLAYRYEQYTKVRAVPYDIPVIGYRTGVVNTLRLWSAEPSENGFDFASFGKGDYVKAVENIVLSESISQILYPDDSYPSGKILRLKQEYFLVSAGIQSIIRNYKKRNSNIRDLHNKIAIHLNDTHPALAVPELMRILMDEEGLGWDEAWMITTSSLSYTNHTILSEALEKWPIDIFKELLPRIYMIVHEINERQCRETFYRYGDLDRVARMAIEAHGQIRMANLVISGSHSVNGVAKLHTEILKTRELSELYDYSPEKFNNKTNGITHRRWLLKANPDLSNIISKAIGVDWIKNPEELIRLKPLADDSGFQKEIQQVKWQNKNRLSTYVEKNYGVKVDPDSIFDIQVKRLHAYKRQTLNVFHIMDLYHRLLENPSLDIVPRTFIFGAKAAPGYHYAKTIIKMINRLADIINNDQRIQDKIKVVFLENYNISIAELVIPAADVSEQISTATKEASGTGNMKFMMNGAATVATMDGANIEIYDQVGPDNIFLFGLTSQQVLDLYKDKKYSSFDIYKENDRMRKVLDQLVSGYLAVRDKEFIEVYNSLLMQNDEFFVLKDFDSYINAQNRIDGAFRDRQRWERICINNIAHSGVFSSDRTINEYCSEIWGIVPVYFNNL